MEITSQIGHLKLVFILTFGFTLASILGYFSQLLRLSPILGYLLGGYLIGPYSPGFVADLGLAEQLAEIGVILMMFGVGLHFKWEDLLNVKNIAIPGALGQTFVAATLGTLLVYLLGWSVQSGLIIGLAIGVASTVVLVRMLVENNLLNTPQGHIAIGWLIVEDILTVLVLIMIPTISQSFSGEGMSLQSIVGSVLIALFKFCLLFVLMYVLGRQLVSYILLNIARTRSQELFTVTILALILVIATGSTLIFGSSIALGAFIAGIIIGQTAVRHQAAANSLPMKDAFAVLFFLSVGMLFNPNAIGQNFVLFIGILFIILFIKPLSAFLIAIFFKHSLKTALTVAFALAQIGEFSFILAEEAMKVDLIPDEGYDVIVACALVSISINPLMFKVMDRVLQYLKGKTFNSPENIISPETKHHAIVIGYGPIGKKVTEALDQMRWTPLVIDTNVDTITMLIEKKKQAVYGDATQPNILKIAHLETASILVITVPEEDTTKNIVVAAKDLNPNVHIIARGRYLGGMESLEELKIDVICDEDEAVNAFIKKIQELDRVVV